MTGFDPVMALVMLHGAYILHVLTTPTVDEFFTANRWMD